MRAALALALVAASAAAQAPLPEGHTGLAAKHPDDAGIAKNPAVVFHDDFEDARNADDLRKKWDAGVFQDAHIRLAEEPENRFGGRRALEFTVPQQAQELSNSVAKQLKEERDVLFLRYYSKFEKGFDQVGSSHNGGVISAHYFKDGRATPGERADGKNKFLVSYENWRGEAAKTSPGDLNVYVYHPEMFDRFGDHFLPSGTVLPNSSARSGEKSFGKKFVERKDVVQELDRWYCYELMVQANAPGKRDGRIACWLDGRLVADFPNLRLRDVPELRIDRFALDLHIGSNTARANRKWYDDVVAATSYVGPKMPKKK